MKYNSNNLREKVDAAKSRFEKQTFKVGGLSIRLTSTLIYVACLLCAIFIWANVSQSSTETSIRRFDNVSVVVEGESALMRNNLTVFGLEDKIVSVTVEGAKNKVDALTDEDIVAYIDVGEVTKAGNVRLSVSVKGINKLDSVVTPSSVKTFIDERVEVDIPVSVDHNSTLISEYDYVLSTNIDTVMITGAKSIVERVKEARAIPELGDLITTSITTNAPLELVDETGEKIESAYITSTVRDVVVEVDVYSEKTVPLTYTYKYGNIRDKNLKVKVTPAEITLRGDPMILSGIEELSIIELDETKLTKINDNINFAVSPRLPEGVTDVNGIEGFDVDVELLNCTKLTLEIPHDNISVKNADSYTYRFHDDVYKLECIVDAASAKKVSAEDFVVEIDFSAAVVGLGGYHELTPKITVKDVDFTLYPIDIRKIKADITENK